MGTFKKSTRVILDKQQCYELWIHGRNSIYDIPGILYAQGIVGKGGNPVTPQACWRSASMYILENPDRAKVDAVSLLSQEGKILDEVEWGKEMIGRARQFLSRVKYRQFLALHPEYRQYE